MSLILEALQRADQDRRETRDVPGIDADHLATEAPRAPSPNEYRSSKIYVPLLLGLVVALLIYLVILQWPITETENTNSSRTATAPPMNQTINSGSFGSEPESQVQPSRTAQENILIAEQPIVSVDDRLTPEEIEALYEMAKEQQPDLLADSQANPVNEQSDSLEPTNVADGQVVSGSLSAADSIYLSIPFARQLSNYQRSAIPAIRYTTHGYSEETGSGMVTLNGRSRRRGDSLEGGLLLIDIRADYIVLDLNGTLFKLAAATDWVP